MTNDELLDNEDVFESPILVKEKTKIRGIIYFCIGVINIFFYLLFIKGYQDFFVSNLRLFGIVFLGPLVYSLIISLVLSLIPYKKRSFKIKYVLLFVLVAIALQMWLLLTFLYVYCFQIV